MVTDKTKYDYELQKQLSIYLTQAFTLLHHYEWLANSYVAEFFVEQSWKKFPMSWRKCFEELTLEEIATHIMSNKTHKTYKHVWPLSLLSFIASCHSLCLNRAQKDFLQTKDKKDEIINRSKIFSKHIKPKKRHELSFLPSTIHQVCEKTNSLNVVDVGSGLGHLSRMLAYLYTLHVTAIEMAGQRLPLAEKFDKDLENELKRINSDNELKFGEVNHVTKLIVPDIKADEFISLINVNEQENSNCVLVGLHTCGDLASTMLKVFHNTSVIKGIVSVSCCYFRMTLEQKDCKKIERREEDVNKLINQQKHCNQFTISYLYSVYENINQNSPAKHNNTENKSQYGFPLSKFLQGFNYQPLQYKSFEVACHFVDDYIEKLLTNSPNLKLHCYRAVMEVFIRYVDPKLIMAAVRCKKIKNAASLTFEEYTRKVFQRLKIELDMKLLEEINYKVLLSEWKNVVVYHTLIHLLGPVIESIALVDKWMYLLELGYDASLVPLFNPKISPRNFVLIATKE